MIDNSDSLVRTTGDSCFIIVLEDRNLQRKFNGNHSKEMSDVEIIV